MQQPDPVPDSEPVLIVSDGEKGNELEKIDSTEEQEISAAKETLEQATPEKTDETNVTNHN